MSLPVLKSTLLSPVFLIGLLFTAFQVWILFDAQQPMFQRPVHLVFALVLLFLCRPLTAEWLPRPLRIGVDAVLIAATLGVGAYYLIEFDRLNQGFLHRSGKRKVHLCHEGWQYIGRPGGPFGRPASPQKVQRDIGQVVAFSGQTQAGSSSG